MSKFSLLTCEELRALIIAWWRSSSWSSWRGKPPRGCRDVAGRWSVAVMNSGTTISHARWCIVHAVALRPIEGFAMRQWVGRAARRNRVPLPLWQVGS